jgi:hypothetical protein
MRRFFVAPLSPPNGEAAATVAEPESSRGTLRPYDQRVLPGSVDHLWGTAPRGAIGEFVTHYHFERNHQGLGNRVIFGGEKLHSCGAFAADSGRAAG